MQNWVRKCDDEHCCISEVTPLLPTRVLDLGVNPDYESARLVETQNQRENYIALSYCWGNSGTLTTTSQTLQDRKLGIRFADLPQTFRNVVDLAWMLSIRYVWIDSLCIIQENLADWEEEAPKMAEIYSNSYLTISAAHAHNPSEGCIPRQQMFSYCSLEGKSAGMNTEWDQRDFVKIDLSLSFRRQSKLFFTRSWMPMSNTTSPRVYCNGHYGEKGDPIFLERVSSRAWTLQERLLSPRLLHFCRDQMFWECKSLFTAEDGTRFDLETSSIDSILQAERNSTSEQGHQTEFVSFTGGFEPQLPNYLWEPGWLSVIRDYTRRRL